jgi:uncharacterized membrane protein YhaH (DUF805 family)
LLVAGAAITLTPICAWYASMDTPFYEEGTGEADYYWPYSFAFMPVLKLVGVHPNHEADTGQPAQEPAAQVGKADKPPVAGGSPSARGSEARAGQKGGFLLRLLPDYVTSSWKLLSPAERQGAVARVLRYYRTLILPIALALGALLASLVALNRSAPDRRRMGRLPYLINLLGVLVVAIFIGLVEVAYAPEQLLLRRLMLSLGTLILLSAVFWAVVCHIRRWHDLGRSGWYTLLLVIPLANVFIQIYLLSARAVPAGSTGAEDSAARAGQSFVLLFALWWLLDMSFCFISPHSYEQYYLPLNASGAMLGSYLVGLYAYRLRVDRDRARWRVLGLAGLLVMIILSWHIFFGVTRSPHTGARQAKPYRGYLQKWEEIRGRPRYPPEFLAKYIPQYHVRSQADEYAWLFTAEYIRERSQPNDTVYVWGWFSGINVEAQRFSPAPKAFEGTMHTLTPEKLQKRIQEILAAFERQPPKFIVDARKIHFPNNRPPLELWPTFFTAEVSKGASFLPTDDATVKTYDRVWMEFLRRNCGADEARRYEALAPLRKYIRENYRVAEPRGYVAAQFPSFGLPTQAHELFELQTVFVRK